MNQETGKFTVSFDDERSAPVSFDKEAIFIGRLKSCNVFLNHKSVSRIHAEINFSESRYFLANLSASNLLTLNGRFLGPGKTDALSDGDIIQIGPYVIRVEHRDDGLALTVQKPSETEIHATAKSFPKI